MGETVQRVGPPPRVFVPVRLTNPRNNVSINLRGLCDSGNTLNSGSGISKGLASALGVRYGGKTVQVGTARQGAEIRSLGTCDPLTMEVPGLGNISLRPTVLSELSHHLNLGAGCLSANNLSLDFRGNTPTLRGRRGATQLISVVTPPSDETKPTDFSVTVAMDQTLRPLETGKVLVNIPVTDQQWGFKSGISDPRVVPIPGRYQDDHVYIRNMQQRAVTIRQGKSLGQGAVKEPPPGKTPPTQAQLKELWTRLRLDDNQVLKEHPAAATKLRQILHKRYHVFSREDDKFGRTVDHEMTIRLQPGTKPIRQKLRPLNPDMTADLKKQLESWLAAGVVRPSRSAWASPLVPVRKKDGSTRWAVDYRRLNAVTLPDAWPIPNVSELLMRLGGSKYFSSIDCVSAYHTIPLDKDSRELTAFVTPQGLYEWLCMPFGLCNAGGEFTRFIEDTLREVPDKNRETYVDDNMLHSIKLMYHLELLDQNFAAYEKRGVKIGPEKTELLKTEIQFLGHQISSEGISMVPAYVERVLNWPEPKNPKELNSMLGFFGYYADHIVGYGTLTAEMNGLKKTEPEDFKWTPKMTANFTELKSKFKQAPIRAFPQWNSTHPFLLQTDFSGLGLGAVLSQVQGDKERLIAAASRKATKYERNYSSFKGELAALMFGVRKFSHMLMGREFIAITDHAALKHLSTLKDPRGIAARWIEELQGYQFKVQHKAGLQNSNADGLSRAPQLDPPDPEMEQEEATYVGILDGNPGGLDGNSGSLDGNPGSLDDNPRRLDGNSESPTEGTLDRANLINAQKRDPVLRMVRAWIEEGPPPKEVTRGLQLDAQRYLQVLDAIITTRDGLLGFKYNLNKPAETGQLRALVPEELKEQVFLHLHCHPMSGHFGVEATKKRARSRFYYPGMCDDIAKAVHSCAACVAKIRSTDHKKGVAHQPRRTGYPMQTIYIDLVGPLPVTTRNNRYILTCEDAFTRWVQAVAIPNKEAVTVAKHFVDKWIYLWGTPTQVHSDNGREFTARVFSEVMRSLNIQKTFTPAYNPQSNPVERFHRSLHSTMRVVGEQQGGEWERVLPVACFAYNTKGHSATGLSPHYALLGREARLPVDLLVRLPDEQNTDPHDFVRDLRTRFRQMHEYMKGKEESQIMRNSHGYDEGTIQDWKEGQLVWYFLPKKVPGRAPKHSNGWTGPWLVVKKEARVLIRIRPANQEGAERVVHASRLRRVTTPRANMGRLPEGVDLDSDDDEEPTRLTQPGAHMPTAGVFPQSAPLLPPAPVKVRVQNVPNEAMEDQVRVPDTGTPKTHSRDEIMEELPDMPMRVWEPESEDENMAEHMDLSLTKEARPHSIREGARPKTILNQKKKKIQHQPYRPGTLQKMIAGVPTRYPTRGTRAAPMELDMVPESPDRERGAPRGPLQIQGAQPQPALPASGSGQRKLALTTPQPANTQLALAGPPPASAPLALVGPQPASAPAARAAPRGNVTGNPQPSLEAPASQLALQYQPPSPQAARTSRVPLPVRWEGQSPAEPHHEGATPAGNSKRARPSSTSEHEATARIPAQKQLRIKGGQRQRALSPPSSPVTSDQEMAADSPKQRKHRPRSIMDQARRLIQDSTSDSLDTIGPAQSRTPGRAQQQAGAPVSRAQWSLRSTTSCTLPARSLWRVPTEGKGTPAAGELLVISDRDSLLQRGVSLVDQVTQQRPQGAPAVLLRNHNREPVRIQAGERLAQARLVQHHEGPGICYQDGPGDDI